MNGKTSGSSVYATDEEPMSSGIAEEGGAGCSGIVTRSGKRRSILWLEGASSGEEGSVGEEKRGKSGKRRLIEEEERVERIVRKKAEGERRRRRQSEEDMEVSEREIGRMEVVKVNNEVEEGQECEDRITKVQKVLGRIQGAVGRESGGKIAFTRTDQQAVKDAIYVIQNEILELVKVQMKLERKVRNGERVEEVKKANERKRMSGKGEERRSVRASRGLILERERKEISPANILPGFSLSQKSSYSVTE